MTKRKNEAERVSTHHELVTVDLEYPRVQGELAELDLDQLLEVRACVEKIQKMTWAQILATSSKSEKRGLNWEVISDQKTATGAVIASIRVSRKFRARVTRDGATLRFISFHPDHDSAYEEPGGEDV
ncbi:MAG: hypothetical protein HYW49_08870 [Deltaproteobacteria bacterium]|nr:hypothetical protein [Deltaproteobacteria bacterium]